MFEFLTKKKKKAKAVVIPRKEHCISRKDIDQDALKVLYRLSDAGYTAYLVGGGVRDLLLGRAPKDFDVGTSARPNEVRKLFKNCFLIGRRFRLAHIKYGNKIIETATFRQNSQTVGEIIEHAAEGPQEDNSFGTPQTDAYRRDFTVNGLFYNIKDYTVIDYVGGMKDLQKKIIRSIGDPEIRFQEDPVRMMRAIKFSSRLGFTIEKATIAAICKYHSFILSAAAPRVCEEIFRLFTFGHSCEAFKMMWEYGLLHDLMPNLSDYITNSGGKRSPTWKYMKMLDEYDRIMRERDYEVCNGLRLAVLYAAYYRSCNPLTKTGKPKKSANSRATNARVLTKELTESIKIPKATYFTVVLLLESSRRLMVEPNRGKSRFIYNMEFLDALDYNRIILRAEKKSEDILNMWSDLYDQKESKNENNP